MANGGLKQILYANPGGNLHVAFSAHIMLSGTAHEVAIAAGDQPLRDPGFSFVYIIGAVVIVP